MPMSESPTAQSNWISMPSVRRPPRFRKGWPIVDKSAPFSAAAEALEEAGVEGEVDSQSIGSYPYIKRLKDNETRPLTVEVFALRVTRELSDWPEQGQRQRRWFSLKEAAQSVDEEELAEIIRAFQPAL